MSHIHTSARADAARAIVRPAILVALFAVALAPVAKAGEPVPPPPASSAPANKSAPAAVFIAVRNLAGDALKGKEQAFEDLVASRVAAESGVAILSRAEAVKRLSAAEGKQADLDGDKVDRSFDDGASALRLAQNLDAEGILSVSLVSYGKETLAYAGNGIASNNDRHTLRVSWKLLEAGRGSGIVGGTETATRTVRQVAGLMEIPGDLMNGLLDDAAAKVAEGVRSRLAGDRTAPASMKVAAVKRVKFNIGVTGRNVFFPELSTDKDGVLRIAQDKTPVQLDGVTVELDGAAIGTAPFAAPVEARPGLHKLRLSRDGFKPWQGVVNLHDGFTFNASLELDDAGLRRWREQSAFIQELKAGEKLTDARVAFIRAQAENLKNYGFKVDFKVDAKELPEDRSNTVNVIPGVAVPVR